MSTLRSRIFGRGSLRKGTDAEGTIARTRASVPLSPEDLWLLACSALLASIGLDVNSAAVVIGAGRSPQTAIGSEVPAHFGVTRSRRRRSTSACVTGMTLPCRTSAGNDTAAL